MRLFVVGIYPDKREGPFIRHCFIQSFEKMDGGIK